jgi:hypothetical protein
VRGSQAGAAAFGQEQKFPAKIPSKNSQQKSALLSGMTDLSYT